ncbi:hypothetical protein G3435_22185 [Pseudomonas sp. MAFF212428]|uniref:Uncharacterized protein n=1 Tax=Pseudomonas brassicae TaxID=2708063 RepID=A0A6B3P0Q8_9PSED|nr:hypothetical protein [Pseudomonas brassicae]NER61927.1 hypothetical protein [Pseudomonas brassicae]NER65497.1 hypothetical protein [Pseudomonas brassicae]
MSYRARRRELKIAHNPLQLILCVALGLWLGFVAIALTLWLAWQYLPGTHEPLREALAPPAPAVAPQQSPEQNQMFEQYKEILRSQAIQQAEEHAQGEVRNLSNPRCQFWLQQNRTAPTEKSRANVLEFCR